MQRVISARRNKPMFLIDIAVPRNIEPAVNDLDNVFLYDIDDLQEVVNANLRERQKEAERAEEIVAGGGAHDGPPQGAGDHAHHRQLAGAVGAHSIGGNREGAAQIGPVTPQQEERWETLTRGIINKVAHGPISEIAAAGGPAGWRAT